MEQTTTDQNHGVYRKIQRKREVLTIIINFQQMHLKVKIRLNSQILIIHSISTYNLDNPI